MCNTFLIECSKTIIVDAGAFIEDILAYTNKVDYIFLTHGHFDHIYYLNDYLKTFPNCKVVLGENAIAKLKDGNLNGASIFGRMLEINIDENRLLIKKEGDSLDLQEQNQIFELYGHTNCSLGLKIEDKLFLGDVIFKNGIGRYDLPTGDFEQTQKTLQRLKKMQDVKLVYCGHDVSPFEI